MRTIVAFLALLAVAFTSPAFATEKVLTPDSVLLQAASISKDAHSYEAKMCPKPRNNTPEQCRADFKKYYSLGAKFGALLILYLTAVEEGNEAESAVYNRRYLEAQKVIVEWAQHVEKLYYPLPDKVSQNK